MITNRTVLPVSVKSIFILLYIIVFSIVTHLVIYIYVLFIKVSNNVKSLFVLFMLGVVVGNIPAVNFSSGNWLNSL